MASTYIPHKNGRWFIYTCGQSSTTMQSPHFTPPKRSASHSSLASPPDTPTKKPVTTDRRKRNETDVEDAQGQTTPLRRSKRISAEQSALPPTPKSAVKARKMAHVACPGITKSVKPKRGRKPRSSRGIAEATVSDDLALGPIHPAASEEFASQCLLPKVILAQGMHA